jgi:hypothetical protein
VTRDPKEPFPLSARWFRRLNGAGMDPQIGYPADSVSYRRLPDGVRCCLCVGDHVIASIDWDPADVRAARDALTQVLTVLGKG